MAVGHQDSAELLTAISVASTRHSNTVTALDDAIAPAGCGKRPVASVEFSGSEKNQLGCGATVGNGYCEPAIGTSVRAE